MKVELDDKWQISFPLEELLERLSLEDKLKLADILACGDDVIKYVGQQILDGWTEHGSHGYHSNPIGAHDTALDQIIREGAMKSSTMAARHIQNLQDALNQERELIAKLWKNIRAKDARIEILEHRLG